ncbi:hypothetical protein LPJ59_004605, partial [Coemansia sp. RSA 2399]
MSSSPSASSYSRARKKESRIPAPPNRDRAAADTQQPINYHSRSAAREQLRRQKQQQQQGYTGGGVLADVNTLREQQNRDTTTHSAFVSGPLDSLSTSAYVSGHLTPS